MILRLDGRYYTRVKGRLCELVPCPVMVEELPDEGRGKGGEREETRPKGSDRF